MEVKPSAELQYCPFICYKTREEVRAGAHTLWVDQILILWSSVQVFSHLGSRFMERLEGVVPPQDTVFFCWDLRFSHHNISFSVKLCSHNMKLKTFELVRLLVLLFLHIVAGFFTSQLFFMPFYLRTLPLIWCSEHVILLAPGYTQKIILFIRFKIIFFPSKIEVESLFTA